MKIFNKIINNSIVNNTPSDCIIGSGSMKEILIDKIFDILTVDSKCSIDIILTDRNDISVYGDDNIIENVIIDQSNGILNISMRNGSYQYNKLIVSVPYSSIDNIKLSGSGDVYTKDVMLNKDKIDVTLKGSGDIKVEVKCELLNLHLNGSGDITILGEASDISIELRGSGDIDTREVLSSKNLYINIIGSGDVKSSVGDKCNLNANIVGSGDIRIKGTPLTKVESKTGSGSIKYI